MSTYFKTIIIGNLLHYFSENVLNKGVKFTIYMMVLENLMTKKIARKIAFAIVDFHNCDCTAIF